MARLPLTIDDPDYDRRFRVFARDMGSSLADTLLDKGLSKEKAHSIVGSFLFDFAMMFDAGGSYKTESKYKPRMAFDNGLGQLTVPTSDTHLHDLVYEIVETIFNVEGRR